MKMYKTTSAENRLLEVERGLQESGGLDHGFTQQGEKENEDYLAAKDEMDKAIVALESAARMNTILLLVCSN